MRIAPEIAALIKDPAPLLHGAEQTRAASQRWRDERAAMLACLSRFGAGAELADCPHLAALFGNGIQAAAATAEDALAPMIAAMRSAPLAPVPWRHFDNGVLFSLVLAIAGRGSLSLALLDGDARRVRHDPRGDGLVSFQPGEMHVRVLAGSGMARILRNRLHDAGATRIQGARIEQEPLPLARGVTYRLDGAREALAIDRIDGMLVTLRLHRKPAGSGIARQFDVASGALVHQAAALQDDSRAELSMASLRAMERRDAAQVIAGLALEGEPAARWQALRECLAIDSSVGLDALCRIADRPGDLLAVPARALLDRLCTDDPAFRKAREELLCHA